MKKRKSSHVSKDKLSLTRVGDSSVSIPTDLIIEILSRLSVKTIARFRRVSKQWASILLCREFTELYLKLSWARPRLLFIVELKGQSLFFSTPLPLNPDQNSSPLVADRHMSFSTKDSSYGDSVPVCGWLCSKNKNPPMMCNPSTGQCITLPKETSTRRPSVATYLGRRRPSVTTYLGYDPIDKLIKLLCVSNDVYRVLTFGNGEMSWRMIDCPIPHCPSRDGICIEGILYYMDVVKIIPYILVCFDVRFEKFTYQAVDSQLWNSTLINCNGKLGAVIDSIFYFTRATTSLELWVLEDAENQKWSKHIYVLPPLWRDIVEVGTLLYIVGMTGTGEFVFAPLYQPNPYIFFYNVVRNTVVRVKIQLGMRIFKSHKIFTFVDHVQDVKLMEALGSS